MIYLIEMEDPLLSSLASSRVGEGEATSSSWDCQERKSRKRLARWVLKLVMWVILIPWAALIFFFPLKAVSNLVDEWITSTEYATPFGSAGSVMMVFSGPILLIALLGSLYLYLSDGAHEDAYHQQQYQRKSGNKSGPTYNIWTFPIIVYGPFGVVTLAEAIRILLFLIAVVWGVIYYTAQIITDVSSFPSTSIHLKWALIFEDQGAYLGSIGIFCLVFLFIPIARGSVLLQLFDFPFEHVVRYHVWLGHLTMLIFTLHGVSFVVAWYLEGNLLQDLHSWNNEGIAVLPGEIALACGLLIWVTSIPIVRKKYFELFYYTHHLYIGFIVFLALHVGDYYFSIALGGILIFMLDRFLRFCQSRKVVDVISLKNHSCGVLELVIYKPPNVRYNAMSFVFVNARDLSLLQWHPFSVSSSPIDGKNQMAILVKGIGDWTTKLNEQVSQYKNPPRVYVEGPYGHTSSYYLMYANLVLVAGGIGISPFRAILRDVMHRAKDGRSIFPKNISIVWAIKKSSELSLLLDLEIFNPSLDNQLNLEFQLYVTQPSEPENSSENRYICKSISCLVNQNPRRAGISPLVGNRNRKWSSLYVSSSILGFVLILGLVDAFYVTPFDVSNKWYRGLVLLGCMVASVLAVGGTVVALWHLSSRNELTISEEQDLVSEYESYDYVMQQHNFVELRKMIKYGCRPNFKEIFERLGEKWGSKNVGVIVCGPSSMESSVAKEIRRHGLHRNKNQPVFHFHTNSFQL